MKILLVDNLESRRETIAAHTGAEVVRVMPRVLLAAPEVLHGVDALAICGNDACEAHETGASLPDCPNVGEYSSCECRDGLDVVQWLVKHTDAIGPKCLVVMLGGDHYLSMRMNDTLHDPRLPRGFRSRLNYHEPTWWRPNCPKTRAGLRKAFGLPAGLEVAP
jgi:hypothetical protein